MTYFVKQLVGALAMPLVAAFLMGVGAGICQMYGRRRSAACLLVSAVAVGYLCAIVPVGDALLGPLERQYSPLRMAKTFPAVDHVVVLGSGYSPRDGIPVTGALDGDGLVRVVEGIRLARSFGAMQLVVSGGAPLGRTPSALGYAELARGLGIDDAALVILDEPLDTAAEARAIAALLGGEPFVLVTSAYHMPRAVRLMQRVGAHPIPAPTGQYVDPSAPDGWRVFLPTSGGLRKTERALHEYLGLAALAVGIG